MICEKQVQAWKRTGQGLSIARPGMGLKEGSPGVEVDQKGLSIATLQWGMCLCGVIPLSRRRCRSPWQALLFKTLPAGYLCFICIHSPCSTGSKTPCSFCIEEGALGPATPVRNWK